MVYCVGDSPDLRSCLRELEVRRELKVVGVTALANEALAGIQKTRPHLVVVDSVLVEGDAIDVLKGLADFKAPPLIYVFAAADDRTRQAFTSAGATRFFTKSEGLGGFCTSVSLLASSV
jgi:DNA-binding response OmpR family regulator